MRGNELVIILDFGSQYSNLIARRVREADVYCEIVQHDIKADKVRAMAPKGIILSGGGPPASTRTRRRRSTPPYSRWVCRSWASVTACS